MSLKKFRNQLNYKNSLINTVKSVFINHNYFELSLINPNYTLKDILKIYRKDFIKPELLYYVEDYNKVTGVILYDNQVSAIMETLSFSQDLLNLVGLNNYNFYIDDRSEELDNLLLLHDFKDFIKTEDLPNQDKEKDFFRETKFNFIKASNNNNTNLDYIKFTIDIEVLIRCCLKNNIRFVNDNANTLVVWTNEGLDKSLALIDVLRGDGTIIQQHYETDNIDEAIAYAKSKDFGGVLFFQDSSNVSIVNMEDDSIIISKIDNLL